MNVNDKPASSPYSFPIRIHLFVAIVSFVVLLGVALGVFHYQKITTLIIDDAEVTFDRIAKDVLLKFESAYHPVATTVDLLSFSGLLKASSFEQRAEYLEPLTSVLRTKPELLNMLVGYANSEALIVRRINNESERNQYGAAVDTAYVVDNIETDSGVGILTRYYYSTELVQLGVRSLGQTTYDPLARSWYKRALSSDSTIATEPYMFFFSGLVGITVAKYNTANDAVVAADISINNLSKTLKQSQITQGSLLYLIDKEDRLLASSEGGDFVLSSSLDDTQLKSVKELNNTLLNKVISRGASHYDSGDFFQLKEDKWLVAVRDVDLIDDFNLRLVILVPTEELLFEAIEVRHQSVLITILVIFLSIPVALLIATKIANPLKMLAEQSSRVRRFDFSKPTQVKSFILEISDLSRSIQLMQDTIHNFIEMINAVAGEKDFERLLEKITSDTMHVSSASGAIVYLLSEDETMLNPSCFMTPEGIVKTRLTAVNSEGDTLLHKAIKSHQSEAFTVDRHEKPENMNANRISAIEVLDAMGVNELKVVVFPLRNRQLDHIGMICLLFDPLTNSEASADKLDFVQAVAGFSALTIESSQMVEAQKNLLDAFIKLIAGAIDEKSPYTGGHCQRVPELTHMLAQAASTSDDERFSGFKLKKAQWEELHIASWLHDCGKVTTPEYVIDKSTKLETIYDRIHEIRMRFEVAKREAELSYWKAIARGGNEQALKPALERALAQLDEDFVFIAECNQGGEFMAPEKLSRLRQIAKTTWTRTLDDRIGLSWEELQRKDRSPVSMLPVQETILADRDDHIIAREPSQYDDPDNPWGFRLDVPENKFNKGELYNLSVERGTLTAEERFIINNHITQTIIMLNKLPFPKQMSAVPEIAGGHHEKMDGTGYPKRLKRDDMPMSARMMAIADIFEALTASDRPYKRPKTLSQAIEIMGHMKNNNHIDADLFELFLTSGIYLVYGEKYLQPEQIDHVDISRYLNE
ncbi:HD domain-containing phosphohydrolase [Alkalimarinus alittae]|uniref:Uncharacterized protein n=1 Tax=Alkalimarinus alittae TaxID=2961619 RepID=A0ABY6N3B7_9ALTE|nr:HD domain-containing phosphohydrolase [Alkalimarinus alittae]UZE96613.1 hypothetical protein NKI27_02355 [Alkalimarinus alittae]